MTNLYWAKQKGSKTILFKEHTIKITYFISYQGPCTCSTCHGNTLRMTELGVIEKEGKKL